MLSRIKLLHITFLLIIPLLFNRNPPPFQPSIIFSLPFESPLIYCHPSSICLIFLMICSRIYVEYFWEVPIHSSKHCLYVTILGNLFIDHILSLLPLHYSSFLLSCVLYIFSNCMHHTVFDYMSISPPRLLAPGHKETHLFHFGSSSF